MVGALSLVGAAVLPALPTVAQAPSSARVAPSRPEGTYAGVEPGEAQPPPAYRRAQRRRAGRRQAVIVTWPGFAPLGDGGSRFFVQTTESREPTVEIEEGRVVLLFRNTRIHLRNNRRWLETRFFNTPVLRARLERRGRNTALVLIMRASAQPRLHNEAAPGGNFHYSYVEFPPGDYAPVISPIEDSANANAEPEVRTTEPAAAPAREVDPTLR